MKGFWQASWKIFANPFYRNTFHHRRNFSCETALLRLTEDWRTSCDNKEIVAVELMELSKAFDTACIIIGEIESIR